MLLRAHIRERPGCQRWVRSLFANVHSCQLPCDVHQAPHRFSLCLYVSLLRVHFSLCVAVFLSSAHRSYRPAPLLPINPCLWMLTDPWVSEEEQKCSVKRPFAGTSKELKFHALLFIFLLLAALKLQHISSRELGAWAPSPEGIADAKAGRQEQSEPGPPACGPL